MDTDHLLQDVFDTAIRIVKESRQPEALNLQQVLQQAEDESLKVNMQIMQGTIRSKRAALHKMLEEWRETRKMVRTRWSNDYDRRAEG